ncbi:MAG TPA: Hsp20/alpha crystallin family protein [Chroococcales cyanobacterium]
MTSKKKLVGTAVAAAIMSSTIGLPSLADTNNTNNCPGKKLEVNTAPISDLERKYFELKTQVDRLTEPSTRIALPWFTEPLFAFDSMIGGLDSFGRRMEQLAGHSLMLDTQWDGYLPRMETSETDKQVKIAVEVPGIDESNLDVSVRGDTITIKGHKEDLSDVNDRSKRASGRRCAFERTMKLPCQVDGEKAEAILKNGVLTVTVPKLPGQQEEGKKIAIRKE